MDVLLDLRDIKGILNRVNNDLLSQGRNASIIVVGYSSLILGGNYERGTEDIDVLEQNERLFFKYGFHLLPDHFLGLHPNYNKRLIRVLKEFSNLKVFRLNNHDLFLAKFNSSRPKDITDIQFMIKNKLVNKSTCTKLFKEWVHYWYNDDPSLREGYNNLWKTS